MKEQSSHSLPSPSGYYDHDTCSWRMLQGSLLQETGEDLTLLDSLPKWGMTVGGVLYELPTSERVTNGRGGFALLVTPTATEKEVGRPERYVSRGIMNDRSTRFDLTDQVAYLHPTPTVQDSNNNAGRSQWKRDTEPLNVTAVKLIGVNTPEQLEDGQKR